MFGKLHIKWTLGLCLAVLLFLHGSSTAVPAQAADAAWDVKYWNNRNLAGDPVLQRTEANLNNDWGSGSPAPNVVNNDNFSARWRRMVYFPAGTYRFTATTDDGMRVWIDDVLIIDSWWDSQAHTVEKDVYINAGDHEVKVKYYEASGQAVAKLSWMAVGGITPSTFLNWKGEYFNNISLAGQPVLVRDDAGINFDWGGGSPAWNVVAADQFSVRWSRSLWLQPGRYRFTVIADDGARLWVNGRLLIDQWHDSSAATYSVEVELPNGTTALQMEYYENAGGAQARLSWEYLSGSTINNWRGVYFNNRNLSGTSVLVRDDAAINFNWGTGSPAVGIVNADNFSVRWTRSLSFDSGRYRFTITSDDGVRLWVNNQKIIDAWNDHAPLTVTGEIDLSGGALPVQLEYYDNTGEAQVNLSWIQVSAAYQPVPTPTPAPTSAYGIVQSTFLNVRRGPGMQYSIIDQLSQSQVVALSGQRSADGNWVVINWAGGTAWISGRPAYLWTSVPVNTLLVWQGTLPPPAVPGSGTATGPTGRVAYAYYLNMRTGPGITHGIIKAIPAGTVVTLLGRDIYANWCKVQLADGSVGWMSAGYLVKSVPMSSLPVVN
jgi:uncharacterized protein YraI